jgi:hypothetical protein
MIGLRSRLFEGGVSRERYPGGVDQRFYAAVGGLPNMRASQRPAKE